MPNVIKIIYVRVEREVIEYEVVATADEDDDT
jgi:hypothetical protein